MNCDCDPPEVNRRTFLFSLLAGIASACAGPTVSGSAKREQELLEQTTSLRAQVSVDVHCHAGPFAGSSIFPGASREIESALADMKTGHVDASLFSLPSDRPVIRSDSTGATRQFREPRPGELFRYTESHFDKVLDQMREIIATSPADVVAFKQKGMPCGILALEGADALEGQPSRVKLFYERGIRVIQLMHYRINEVGDIMTEGARHGGLTPPGQGVVKEMNRLGMIIDVAHAHSDTVRDVLAESRHPVLDSHTRPAARFQHRRARTDADLRAVAAKGGVIGMWPIARRRRGETFNDFLKDFDHLKSLVGIDHIGIGTDLNGLGETTALGMHKDFLLIPAGLLARGYSESEVGKIIGGNFMRLFREVS
jgi:membrane dipeptidase